MPFESHTIPLMSSPNSEGRFERECIHVKLLSISYKLEQWQIKVDCGLEAPYGYMKTYRYSSPSNNRPLFDPIENEMKWKALIKPYDESISIKRKSEDNSSLRGGKRQRATMQHQSPVLRGLEIFPYGRYQLRRKIRQQQIQERGRDFSCTNNIGLRSSISRNERILIGFSSRWKRHITY